VRVEYGVQDMTDEDKHALAKEMTDVIRDRLRVHAVIELVPPFSLPRESGKTSLIEIEKGT
jgi:hypothetical protein